MNTNYNGHSCKPGVYQIRNLNNGKVYIGSAKKFSVRYQQHLKTLNKGTHHNKHLQASFNKHGSKAFIFEVAEVVEGDITLRRSVEQNYIDKYENMWNCCYNTKKKTVLKQGPWSSTPIETAKKLSESSKKMWLCEEHRKLVSKKCTKAALDQWKNEETREKMIKAIVKSSEKFRGKSWGNHSEETKAKIAKSHVGLSSPYLDKKMSKLHIEKCTEHLSSMVFLEKRLSQLRKSLCKKVLAVNGIEKQEFDSILAASNHFDIHRSTIRSSIQKNRPAKNGWTFSCL